MGEGSLEANYDERSPLIAHEPSIGAVTPHDDERHDDNASPAAQAFKPVHGDGRATVISSAASLSNTILGAGILSIPYAFRLVGLLFGVFLLLLGAMAAAFGLRLLVICAERIQPTGDSFSAVARHTFPMARYVIDGAVAVKCFGVAISYLIVAGDLMPRAVTGIRGVDEPGNSSILEERRFWIGLAMAVAVPLSLLPNINALRYASLLAVATVVYVVAMVFVFYFYRDDIVDPAPAPDPLTMAATAAAAAAAQAAGPAGPIRYWEWDMDIFAALPIVVFAYTCAQNIFSVRCELKNPTEKRSNLVIGGSTLLSFSVYAIVGVCGYLTFLDNTPDNVIREYPTANAYANVARIMMSILVVLSYPLQMYPCCVCLHNLLFARWHLPDGSRLHTLRRVLLILTVCAVTFAVAWHVDDLGLVFAIIGATGSTTLCYLLPGALFLKSDALHAAAQGRAWTWKQPRRLLAALMVAWGVVMMVVANYVTVTKKR